jgi:putative hemolysin
LDHHSGFLQNIPLLLDANPQSVTVLIAVNLVLLALSFIFSGAEVAFFSLTYKDVNMLKTRQSSATKRIIELLGTPKVLLASLLIANSFVNICLIIVTNFSLDYVFTELDDGFASYAIKFAIISFLLILFGEVLPKVWATQNNLRFAFAAAPVVGFTHLLLSGFSGRLAGYSDRLEKRMGVDTKSYNLQEFKDVIQLTSSGDASKHEENILIGILKFGNIMVKQIMRTRLDVAGIEFSTNFAELRKKVEEQHYSRLPVYRKNLDEVVGLIYTKDLIPYLHEQDDFNWHALMRPPYFVHEQKLVRDLLQQFRVKRIHFAVVVDEFGGTSGIVTLEDIMEEVIGEIKDEFDEEDSINKQLDERTWIFDGKTMINDACRTMEIPPQTFDDLRGDADSLAGLLLEISGDIPAEGTTIVQGDFQFTPLEVTRNRVLKIKVEIIPQQEQPLS